MGPCWAVTWSRRRSVRRSHWGGHCSGMKGRSEMSQPVSGGRCCCPRALAVVLPVTSSQMRPISMRPTWEVAREEQNGWGSDGGSTWSARDLSRAPAEKPDAAAVQRANDASPLHAVQNMILQNMIHCAAWGCCADARRTENVTTVAEDARKLTFLPFCLRRYAIVTPVMPPAAATIKRRAGSSKSVSGTARRVAGCQRDDTRDN